MTVKHSVKIKDTKKVEKDENPVKGRPGAGP